MDLLDPTWTEIPEGNKRAELYPYSAPQFNFLLNKGELQKLPSSYDLKNKVAILAIGSNRSPSQLLRKFGGNEQIPVTIVNVKDIDVVYASMISYYGAVPATLWPVKGSILKLSIIWLDNRQLKIMHETEAVGKAYDFVKFEKNKIILNEEVFDYYKPIMKTYLKINESLNAYELAKTPLQKKIIDQFFLFKEKKLILKIDEFTWLANSSPRNFVFA